MGFLEDVVEGLTADIKRISSRYFYDAQGDALFQAIMKLPEYYLTKSEFEILSNQAGDILKALELDGAPFDLLEFGAGDGVKTKVLIEQLLKEGAKMRYFPIDISADALVGLKSRFETYFPTLDILPQNALYFEAVGKINEMSSKQKLVLFLGSSIGNFSTKEVVEFLKVLQSKLRKGDKALIGFDLRKDPQVILNAYNDSQGVTKAFNLNLLSRMNRELGAEFQVDAFSHYPQYDPESGLAKSYIVSKKKQTVFIERANLTIGFEAGEVIHTEISKKFTIKEIESFSAQTGLDIKGHFFDCRHYYVNTLFEKI
jgi:dimethylhistidine N-methyltransferase